MDKVSSKDAARALSGDLAKPSLVLKVVERLRERGETVGFAESCTGGLLAAILARRPGVSDIFVGGIVAYSNHVKEDLLGVPSPMLRSLGAVSLPVAIQMAVGLRAQLEVTWALSITGIAGPGGGSPDKPVGTVCVGIAGPGVERGLSVRRRFDGDRRQIQVASARCALRLLLKHLN